VSTPLFIRIPRIVPGAVAALALAVATVAGADDLKDGRNALQAGRFDDAIKSFEKAAAQGFAEGKAGVGTVWLRRRQLDKAMEAFETAQKMNAGLETAYWGQGEVLRRQEKCAEAIPMFQKATELNRKYPEAQLGLGDCLVATRQYEKAVAAYSEGLKWGPKWTPRFLVGLGNAEASRDSLRAAGIYFTRAREQAPSDPNVRQALGDFYYDRGTWALAILEYQSAMALDTADVELHYKLGQALFYDKRYNEALAEYQIAARDPDFAPAYYGLGNLLYLSGAADRRRYEEAKAPLETYVKLAPDDPKGWSVLGRLQYNLPGEKAKALETLRKAESMGDKSKESYTFMGRLYAEQKEWDKALESFQKGDPGPKEQLIIAQIWNFKTQPDSAAAIYNSIIERDSTTSDARFAMNELGKMRFGQKDWTGALGYFQRRIALDPNNGDAYYYSGLSYKQLKQGPEATAALERAAAIDSAKADRWFWLGVVYDEQKRTADARHAFQRSVQLDSTSKLSAKAFAQIGFYRLLDKDWDGAARQLDRAVTVDAQDVQSWVWLGQAYQNSGNRAKATDAYNRALQLNPSQPDALKGLKMLKGQPTGSAGGSTGGTNGGGK
jgi:tetratricopeptide (TPR) repeat protein